MLTSVSLAKVYDVTVAESVRDSTESVEWEPPSMVTVGESVGDSSPEPVTSGCCWDRLLLAATNPSMIEASVRPMA